MTTTPSLAIGDDNDEIIASDAIPAELGLELVELPQDRPDDEADVKSELGANLPVKENGGLHESNGAKEQEESNRDMPKDDEAEDDDEDDEDADEETFAVEKVLNHRIAKKGNVMCSYPGVFRVF
jgi:hypothetical protein